jgi:hypothetical protein
MVIAKYLALTYSTYQTVMLSSLPTGQNFVADLEPDQSGPAGAGSSLYGTYCTITTERTQYSMPNTVQYIFRLGPET